MSTTKMSKIPKTKRSCEHKRGKTKTKRSYKRGSFPKRPKSAYNFFLAEYASQRNTAGNKLKDASAEWKQVKRNPGRWARYQRMAESEKAHYWMKRASWADQEEAPLKLSDDDITLPAELIRLLEKISEDWCEKQM